MLPLWFRLPVVVRAVISGVVVSLVGTLPWALLVRWNQRVLLTVPWAVMPMGIYLWLYWKYLSGAGWPRATARCGARAFAQTCSRARSGGGRCSPDCSD